ncbi:MAG: hypothetical protein EOS10_33515 [Mesorhizobium sp.]|nr:MAG: hypothetical protein EOS10_33515 [Mesorhizobium sp.]
MRNAQLGQWSVERVAYEATGAYHRELEQALADLPCVKLNPARARRFAQAAGTLAKTDRINAVMLARMASTMQPPVRPAINPEQARLAELISARDGLMRDRTALKNQGEKPDDSASNASAQTTPQSDRSAYNRFRCRAGSKHCGRSATCPPA